MLSPVYPFYVAVRDAISFAVWRRTGHQIPPPNRYKQRLVRRVGQDFGIGVLVETGTYLGNMILANRRYFRHIFSIELDKALYRRALWRTRKLSNVTVIHGDSGELLPKLLAGIGEPCLFWLDAHYSAGITSIGKVESPIISELEAITTTGSRGHVVLIDDARCFTGLGGYPALPDLRELFLARWPEAEFIVEHDVIRVLPKATR